MSDSNEAPVNGQSSPQSDSKSSSSVKKSQRIRVSGASGKQEDKELEALFAKFGKVVGIEAHKYQEGVLVVAMESVDVANKAVEEINGKQFQGETLSLNNDAAKSNRSKAKKSAPPNHAELARENYPLRMLVSSDSVGAIIGKGGETIKEITNKSKARIDVKREVVQRPGPQKRIVSSQIVFITGPQDSCSDACKEILTVCMSDSKERTKNDIELNILAEDRHCGRIIGKDGKNLKDIRDKTKATIQLSHSPTVTTLDITANSFSMDRIVTIRGSLDGICKAAVMLLDTLRQCHQTDMPQYNFPPPGPFGANATVGWPYVSFPALDPRRKFKKVAIKATS